MMQKEIPLNLRIIRSSEDVIRISGHDLSTFVVYLKEILSFIYSLALLQGENKVIIRRRDQHSALLNDFIITPSLSHRICM